MRRTGMALLLAAVAALGGCQDDEIAAAPKPMELTREGTGYYCHMIVLDHPGPKAQIHLASMDLPYWFSSVRDAIAFTMLPEEAKDIAAIYVNDMGRAESWEAPGPGTWIDAHAAWYVIGSSRRGGMGALEAVPFANRAGAADFAGRFGGEVVSFDQMPRDYIFAEAEDGGAMEHVGHMAGEVPTK